MLEAVYLENFKASRELNIRLAPLTVLSGLNSSGKSSVLQALAIIRQSYAANLHCKAFKLSGDLVQLGRFSDVLTEDAPSDSILFRVQEGETYEWKLRGQPEDSEVSFQRFSLALPPFATDRPFQFLQADRMVPGTLYPQLPQASRFSGFLGARGEYTAGFLALEGERAISAARECRLAGIGLTRRLVEQTSPTNSLLDQAAGWLQQISPGATISLPVEIKGTDAVSLQFAYTGKTRVSKSNLYRPTNVGFGLTYSLPIIIACLAAEPGALLLLENPEAHLHPQGQAAMGHLLSQCMQDGVQILVETHSDHLVNGIRLAAKNKVIDPAQVALHLFSRDIETGNTSIQTPTLFASGRISNWPEGFFDQWDKDIDALIE